MSRTRGARGGSELNRTLDAKPHALASTPATPKEKHSLHFWFGGGEISFEKGKGVFLSRFCPPSIRAVRGASIRTRQNENLFFLGERIFRFASTDFPPAGGGWGGMRAGFGLGVFGNSAAKQYAFLDKYLCHHLFRK